MNKVVCSPSSRSCVDAARCACVRARCLFASVGCVRAVCLWSVYSRAVCVLLLRITTAFSCDVRVMCLLATTCVSVSPS